MEWLSPSSCSVTDRDRQKACTDVSRMGKSGNKRVCKEGGRRILRIKKKSSKEDSRSREGYFEVRS